MKFSKETKFTLTREVKQVFRELKEQFMMTPLLTYFNPKWETWLETDTSGKAVSGILS